MKFRYKLQKMDVIEAPSAAEANQGIRQIAAEYGADIALTATSYNPGADLKAFGLSGTIRKLIERRIATGEATQDEIDALAKFNTLGHIATSG